MEQDKVGLPKSLPFFWEPGMEIVEDVKFSVWWSSYKDSSAAEGLSLFA